MIAEFVVQWGVNYDIVIECLPPIMTVLGLAAKYMNGVLQVEKLKEVCYMIKSDNERLTDLPEYKVLQMHTMEGRKRIVSFIAAMAVLLLIFLALPTVIIINDIKTKNESMDKYLIFPVNYLFINEQDYYYWITSQCIISALFLPLFIGFLDSMYITFTQHACGMLAVVGCRLKTIHILNPDALEKEFGYDNSAKLLTDEQERMYQKLVLCIKEHKRALEYMKLVQSVFSVALFIQITINIVLMSISGVQGLLKLNEGQYLEVARMVIWMMGDQIHLFFLYLPGQRWVDFSTQVYYDALECMWYTCCKKSRIIYQIMIMNTLKPVGLTVLKVAPLNMEAFLSVMQAAVSYFTVLSSTL